MSTTFETLPDEVLMLILRYSDDVYTTFRIYLGLNYRLNSILLDRRLHLFTDFLCIDSRDPMFHNYYNSDGCQQISHELLYMNATISDLELRQYFQLLVHFYIKEQYMYFEKQIQVNLVAYQTIRQQLTDNEIIDVDNQLQQVFYNLRKCHPTIKLLKQIESLVLTKGACLQCNEHASAEFNFTQALKTFLFSYLSNITCMKEPIIKPMTLMFETLILSNIDLLENRAYVEFYTSDNVWCFLCFSFYYENHYHFSSNVYNSIRCYQITHLLLFTIACQRQMDNKNSWAENKLFNLLYWIPSNEVSNKNGLFMHNMQMEMLNLIADEYNRTVITPWDDWKYDSCKSVFRELSKKNRFDVILLLYRRLEHVSSYFNNPDYIRENVNLMTGCLSGRKLFNLMIDEKLIKSWLTEKDLIFLLLQKKERKLIEKLFKLSSPLIHELDEHGNDPLLYLCLKVRGCRHQIIRFLIISGCDVQRRNSNGVNFFDAIQLKQNRSLLEKLLDHEIVKIDNASGQIEVAFKGANEFVLDK